MCQVKTSSHIFSPSSISNSEQVAHTKRTTQAHSLWSSASSCDLFRIFNHTVHLWILENSKKNNKLQIARTQHITYNDASNEMRAMPQKCFGRLSILVAKQKQPTICRLKFDKTLLEFRDITRQFTLDWNFTIAAVYMTWDSGQVKCLLLLIDWTLIIQCSVKIYWRLVSPPHFNILIFNINASGVAESVLHLTRTHN